MLCLHQLDPRASDEELVRDLARDFAAAIHNFDKFIKDLFSLDSFHLAGTAILEATAIGGLVLVIIGTGCNVLVAVIYNLISDVVGGVEVTVLEEDSSPRPVV